MRNAKAHTNDTFTNRVDHLAERDHIALAPSEPALCPGCGSVYFKRRWVAASRVPALHIDPNAAFTVRICAACLRDTSSIPHGYVHVVGEFFAQHRDEIEHLLHSEVSSARHDNPLHQALRWDDDGTGGLMVATTTEYLAERLGHALNKAYSGEVHYGFSHENKFAHVWWQR
jgi:hypothetical protein